MKLGVSSWTYPWAIGVAGCEAPAAPLDAIGLLNRAAALRAEVLQIADNLPLEHLPGSEIERLAAAANRAGIVLELGTRGVEPPHLARFLHLARSLDARLVRTLAHTDGSTPGLTQAATCLREALPAYERAGVTLAIENYEKHTSGELAELVRSINSPCLGVCLDTVNSLGALETPQEVVRTLAPLAVNLHVKDFDIARVPSMMGFLVSGCPAGTGRLDIPWLLAELRRRGREPSVVLEQWPPFRRTLAETMALECEWAEQGIRYLRRHIHE